MHEPLVLPSEITIYTVADLRTQCLAWLAQGGAGSPDDATGHGSWRVDAAAVQEVDAAGLQLLQSLAHSVALGHPHRHLRLHVQNPSLALAGACTALGFTALLDEAPHTEVAA
jgi:ABC-type transporter Mla MlaB component